MKLFLIVRAAVQMRQRRALIFAYPAQNWLQRERLQNRHKTLSIRYCIQNANTGAPCNTQFRPTKRLREHSLFARAMNKINKNPIFLGAERGAFNIEASDGTREFSAAQSARVHELSP